MDTKTDIKELCPVCGYNLYENLGVYPWDEDSPSDEICPSCGIQFGYDDTAGGDRSKRRDVYSKWRIDWIKGGSRWYSNGRDVPRGWNPQKQLEKLLSSTTKD
jgi:hypothetical protein